MSSDPHLGATLGPYRIESLLGRGGMGRVYLAEHSHLGRKVALKILPPELVEEDRTFRDRFLRESRLAASLDHPHIVPVYDAGEADGQLYLAMRLVPGTDLAKVLDAEGPLEPERLLRILSQAADALEYAHAEGLVHRDVKPSNILLAPTRTAPEHAFLTDFGLARQLAAGRQTRTGTWVGTLHYSAPEQFMGKETGPRTDLYALGCVAYECLTGRVVFDREIDAAVMLAHLQEPPPRATELRPELPPAVDEVLGRAMAKEPEDRFSGPGELAAALEEAIRDRAPRTTPAPVPKEPPAPPGPRVPSTPPAPWPAPTPPPPQAPRSPAARRRRWWIGAAAAGVVVLGGALLLLLGVFRQSPERGTGTATSPFVGSWEATDSTDNSRLTLEVSGLGQRRFRLRLTDDRVTAVCEGESVELTGEGSSQGARLESRLEGPCSPSGTIFTVDQRFMYHPEDDTLTDSVNPGTVWSRA